MQKTASQIANEVLWKLAVGEPRSSALLEKTVAQVRGQAATASAGGSAPRREVPPPRVPPPLLAKPIKAPKPPKAPQPTKPTTTPPGVKNPQYSPNEQRQSAVQYFNPRS